MKILKNSNLDFSDVSLILGFFDGVHAGHRRVIESAVDFAKQKNSKTVLITFKDSPSKFFNKPFKYIFPRDYSYELINSLGVDYIVEMNFEKLAKISAEEYLKMLIKDYSPSSISTGFNHTFGKNRLGNSDFLYKHSDQYNYQYFCIPDIKFENETVSSTIIKKYISEGNIKKVNKFLQTPFVLISKVIQGEKRGRTIGFPTANLEYPSYVEKLPYGVYAVKVFEKPAVLNWGIKPTFNGTSEVLEAHIINFEGDLYGKELKIEFIDKIRDEKFFNSIEDLKFQIEKDIETCLKL